MCIRDSSITLPFNESAVKQETNEYLLMIIKQSIYSVPQIFPSTCLRALVNVLCANNGHDLKRTLESNTSVSAPAINDDAS